MADLIPRMRLRTAWRFRICAHRVGGLDPKLGRQLCVMAAGLLRPREPSSGRVIDLTQDMPSRHLWERTCAAYGLEGYARRRGPDNALILRVSEMPVNE